MVKKTLRNTAFFFLAWLTISLLANGCVCVVHSRGYHEPRTVYVSSPPPSPKHETKTSAPSSGHVWVEGHWDYNEADDNWEWEEGKWKVPPEKGSKWERPKYSEHEGGKSTYTPGKWVRPSHDSGKSKKPTQTKDTSKKDKGPTQTKDTSDKDKGPTQTKDNEKKPGGASAKPAKEDEKPGGASAKPAKEDEKPGGASAKPAKEDEKPGGASAKATDKKAPPVVKPSKAKCNKSRSCNCDGICGELEKAKACGDCR
jgi:hypothetical protein